MSDIKTSSEVDKPKENTPNSGDSRPKRKAMSFSWRAKIVWLFGFYLRFKYVLAALLILTPLHALTIVVQPVIFRNIFDSMKNGPESLSKYDDPLTVFLVEREWTTYTELGWVFLAFATLSFLIYVLLQNHRAWMNVRLEMAFRQTVFGDIVEFGPRFFAKYNTGDLVTRLTNDVEEKLSWFACSGIFRFYEALMLLTFGIAVMISLNPTLTLYVISPLPLLVLLFRASSARMDRRYDRLQALISRLNDVMEACFSGIRVVKAYRQEKSQMRRFGTVVEDRRQAEVSAVQAQTVIESLYIYVWEFGVALALIAGGYMVVTDQITLGEYLAFDFFVMLMIMPMLDIGQFLVKGLQSAVSIDRLMELQSHQRTAVVSGSRKLSSGDPLDLRFDSVHLSLDGKRNIINGVSFTIASGSTVAFVGKIGSGKTWAANLITRLIDPDQGQISLGGVPLPELALSDLRRAIGYVPQESALFSETIEENVRFGREEISDLDLNWSLSTAQLTGETDRLPMGIKTLVGARGLTLSGGQKQRVAMARALAGKPRILILDDCTSALDARTEDRLWESLNQLPFELTSIIITHRTATLRNVDRILVFDDGRLVEDGSHEELILKRTLYANLYHHDELAEAV